MNDDTFAANTAAGKRTNLNRSVNWDTMPLGFYGFNLYESATGGTGYPESQDLGMMMNVKLASNLYAQMCFGQYYYQQRNRSNTTDAWGPWRKSIMYAENDKLKYGRWEAITLPYNVPSDGFISVYLNPSTTAGAYVRIASGGGNPSITAVATSGEPVTCISPVRRNDYFSQQLLTNGTITCRFMPIFQE